MIQLDSSLNLNDKPDNQLTNKDMDTGNTAIFLPAIKKSSVVVCFLPMNLSMHILVLF